MKENYKHVIQESGSLRDEKRGRYAGKSIQELASYWNFLFPKPHGWECKSSFLSNALNHI